MCYNKVIDRINGIYIIKERFFMRCESYLCGVWTNVTSLELTFDVINVKSA